MKVELVVYLLLAYLSFASSENLTIEEDTIEDVFPDIEIFPGEEIVIAVIPSPLIRYVPGCEPVTCSGALRASSLYDCYCDDACMVYQDCCFDYIPAVSDNSSSANFDIDCIGVHLGLDNSQFETQMSYIKAVSSCPTSWENTINTSDSTANFIPPVTDLSTNVTYKNIFFALCHGVSNIKVWPYQLFAPNNSVFVVVDSLSLPIHQCDPDVIRICPSFEDSSYYGFLSAEQYSSLVLQCGSYQKLVIASNEIYSNEYCALCHGHVLS